MSTTLDAEALGSVLARLDSVPARALPPPAPVRREPVHVVYGGAHLYAAGVAAKMGARALDMLHDAFAGAADLAATLGLTSDPQVVYERVVRKLQTAPVEDFRIDFEDGYGHRTDADEDAHAIAAATQLAADLAAGTAPHYVGVRIKPLVPGLRERAIRTADLFLTALVKPPPDFVVTLPKVERVEEVEALTLLLSAFEQARGLPTRSIGIELMVETPAALAASDGTLALPALVFAGTGRVTSVHFGAYDFTAAFGVVAAHQTMDHPACELARMLMKVSLAGSGVGISDGATNVLPIAKHRAGKGISLTADQQAENRSTIRSAARLHADNIRRALREGIYQGWDLHPAQLPVRFAVTHDFFLSALGEATRRLTNFVDRAAQASTAGHVFDDAATGQGLLNFFARGLACGALDARDVAATGLRPDELVTPNFAAIVEARRAQLPR